MTIDSEMATKLAILKKQIEEVTGQGGRCERGADSHIRFSRRISVL